MFFRTHRKDLLEARDREVAALKLLVEALAEQIDYMRQVAGVPNFARAKSHLPAEAQNPELVEGLRAWIPEEEEDLVALRDAGHINELELEQQLAAAGLRNSHLTLA